MKNDNEGAAVSGATKPAPEAADIEKAASAVESYGLTELAQRLRSGIATKPAEPVIPAPRVDELPPLPYTNYNGYSDGSEPLYTAEQMREYAHLARQAQPTDRDAVLKEAIRACENECVDDSTLAEGAVAYNMAIRNCQTAIRALKGKSGSEGAAS